MHRLCWSGLLLIVLAASAAAQGPLIATTPPVDHPARGGAAKSAQQITPLRATERVHTDTATRKSRRRQVIGAALGAVVGAVPGGTYAFLEATSGCKPLVGIPCNKPRHLWVYPVGGAAVGAVIGALIARF
jgi:hypothetical protein